MVRAHRSAMASVADRFHRLAGTVGVRELPGEGAGACRTFLP